MDAQLKAKWVDALRSGKYQQHRGSLAEGPEHTTVSLCCLGVLWAVTGRPARFDELWDRTVGRSKQELIDMNDQQLKSFAEIADFIEANL